MGKILVMAIGFVDHLGHGYQIWTNALDFDCKFEKHDVSAGVKIWEFDSTKIFGSMLAC